MTQQDALGLLEELMELPPQSLTGAQRLQDLEAWDSLSSIAFIAMVDRKLGVPIAGDDVASCQTVADLCRLIDDVARRRAA